MTVTVYIPSWPPMAVMSSISTILPAIRNRIPIGAYLMFDEWYCCYRTSNTSFYVVPLHPVINQPRSGLDHGPDLVETPPVPLDSEQLPSTRQPLAY
ncbi:hypothetical protein EYF80_009147 [Liparis tanakae]|uniref:Uncharacterized protein n=1 Tax=Liparis tanakae TaxID=230148 RepID=A0A4Z2IRL1_9TELE|nr:hypothetical protein EYF80_009147 [Liparis tanakae]